MKPKNLMCKNILEQTKELCYQHSAVYKDFDSIFHRVVTKLVNWELIDDADLSLAGQSLKVMAVSKQIEDLVLDKNMNKLLRIFQSPEMHWNSRLAILDTFIIIAKHISLRPVFLRDSTLAMVMNFANKVLDGQKSGNKPSRYIDLNINCVKLLC